MERLHEELIARIRGRANDRERRTDAPPSTRGRTVSFGGVSIQGLDLNAVLRGDPDPSVPVDTSTLPDPVGLDRLGAIEVQLGFAIPVPLRQLYTEVADGRFGPGAGLLPLEELARAYQGLRAHPPGERGQTWPLHLLPMTWTNPGHECIHVENGKIVYWDEESLADGPSDRVWKRSFRPDAVSLASWFERWLDTKSPEEQLQEQMKAGMNAALRASLDYWRARTPEERAAFGLPEEGWEQALFGHLGIDLSKL